MTLHHDEKPAAHPRAAFALLAAVQVALIGTITLIMLALPAMQDEFALDAADLALLSTAYGLSFSGLLLLGGRVADILGRRRVLIVGMACMGLASMAAAIAPSISALIAARFAQGVGAALAAPAALALVGVVFADLRQARRALSTWGSLASIGAIGGTLLGGAAVSFISWRWTFALPIAVALFAVLAAPRLLPADPPPRAAQLDIPGALLATAGISMLSFGLLAVPGNPVASVSVLGAIAGGVTLLLAFVAVESRTAAPLLPLSLLASAPRGTAHLALMLAAGASAAMTFFLALYFQQVQGLSPLETSAAFLPYAVALLTTGLLASRFVLRWGAVATTVCGLLIGAGGLALLSQAEVEGAYVGVLPAGLITLAFGLGLTFSGATVTGLDGAPVEHAGVIGSVMNTALETGPTIVLAGLVSIATGQTTHLVATGAPPSVAVTGGYALAFALLAAAFLVVAFVTVAVLQRRRTRPASI